MGLTDLMFSQIQMGQLHQVLDSILDDDDSIVVVVELAFRCVVVDKDDHPDAREMVEELKWV